MQMRAGGDLLQTEHGTSLRLVSFTITLAALLALTSGSTIAQQDQRPPEPTTLVVAVAIVGDRQPTERPLAELYYGVRRMDYGYCSSRGEYVFDVREPGMYRVRVTLPGFATPEQEIMMTNGMRYQLFFELHPSESGEGSAAATPRGPPPREVIERMVKARQLRASGDSDGAIQYMERAVEMAPEFASARLELGLYYWRAKKLNEARVSFEKVRELDPTITGAYLCLGQVLAEMGQYTEAEETLLQASQIHPDRAEPLFALAKMHADAGDRSKAEETAAQALERDCSRVPQIHLLLAGLHAEKGDLEGEIASVESYLAIAPAGDLSHIEKRLELLQAELTLKPSIDQYFTVFEDYQNGDRTEALNRLAELPNNAVYRGVEYLRDRDDGQLLDAALMHTDAALPPGSNASLHVSRAATCLKRIDDDCLTASDFEILDDGVRQELDLMDPQDFFLSAMLILDSSASVSGPKLTHLREAAHAFLRRLKKEDEAGLMLFNQYCHLRQPIGADLHSLHESLDQPVHGGYTSLHDALYAGLKLVGKADGRPMVILFTDGQDNSSWLTERDLLDCARESEAIIHAIGIRSPDEPSPQNEPDHQVNQSSGSLDRAESLLRGITSVTGGRDWYADSSAGLEQVFLQVLEEMETRYLLSYQLTGAPKEGWHELEVKLKKRNGETIRARPGYMATTRTN